MMESEESLTEGRRKSYLCSEFLPILSPFSVVRSVVHFADNVSPRNGRSQTTRSAAFETPGG